MTLHDMLYTLIIYVCIWEHVRINRRMSFGFALNNESLTHPNWDLINRGDSTDGDWVYHRTIMGCIAMTRSRSKHFFQNNLADPRTTV